VTFAFKDEGRQPLCAIRSTYEPLDLSIPLHTAMKRGMHFYFLYPVRYLGYSTV
jgi:hypothetical protein